MKLEFSRQIFEKHSNINFHENSSSGIRVVPSARTDRCDEYNSRFLGILGTRLKRPESTSKGDTKCNFITHVILDHRVESTHCLCMSNLNGINRTDEPYKTTDWTRVELQTLLLLWPEMNHFQSAKQTTNVRLVQGCTKFTLNCQERRRYSL